MYSSMTCPFYSCEVYLILNNLAKFYTTSLLSLRIIANNFLCTIDEQECLKGWALFNTQAQRHKGTQALIAFGPLWLACKIRHCLMNRDIPCIKIAGKLPA